MPDVSWGQAAGAILLGLVGLWLANNYRRQIRLKLAERQVDSYIRLWKLTALATPDRTEPLDHVERQKLYDEMVRWYFEDGDASLRPRRPETCSSESVQPCLSSNLDEASEVVGS